MSYRKLFLASLSAVALVLAGSETFADPMAAPRGGAGMAPQRPAFPQAPGRGMHHHNFRGGNTFWPGGVGVFYGLPDEPYAPVEVAPQTRASDEPRYTCVYDIPWDYVHRCPQYSGPRY